MKSISDKLDLNIELKNIQSNLSYYYILYGENIINSLYDILSLKYKNVNKELIKLIIDKGIDGQLTSLNEIYYNYKDLFENEEMFLNKILENTEHELILEYKNNIKYNKNNISEDVKTLFKNHLLDIKLFFQDINNRTKVFSTIEKIRRLNINNEDDNKINIIKKHIIEIEPDDTNLVRIFLINYLDMYGTLDNFQSVDSNGYLNMKYLSNIPSKNQNDIIYDITKLLFRNSIKIDSFAFNLHKDNILLNQIQFYMQKDRDSSYPYVEQLINNLTLNIDTVDNQEQVLFLKKEFLEGFKNNLNVTKLYNDLVNMIFTKHKKDPLRSSTIFRKQRLSKRSSKEKT